MQHLLKKHFGYDDFRPQQEEIITTVMQGKDALVLMPTGGGKSLCYQLPAVMREGLTLVISPLIALMKDQVDALRANGIAAHFINSSLTGEEMYSIEKQLQRGEIKLLYIAPERLAVPSFYNFLKTLPVGLIAIDEAHCISEWGHDFRPDYRNLHKLRELFPHVPFLALTATATEKVRDDIRTQLELKDAPLFLGSFNRGNLFYRIEPKRKAFEKLLRLIEKHRGEPTIVYCFSRKDAESIALDLRGEGHKALPYHAGLAPEVRTRNQEQFIRDEVSIIVATIAFGMGIDKPDVRLIVHYDLPKSVEGYYQETGRAGRDSLPSECVLLYSYGDTIKHGFFINQTSDPDEQARAQKKLDEIIRFCESPQCRRKFLLEYFGETWPEENCGTCDICLAPQHTFDATEITQKILSAVLRVQERFGASYVVDILVGSATQKIQERGHQNLSVYGIVRNFSKNELKEIFRHLVMKGFLEKEEGKYPTLRLSAQGRAWLQHRERLELPDVKRHDEKEEEVRPASSLEFDAELFAQLRKLRKDLADQQGVPPFVIFGDRSLHEMAYYFPQSAESFRNVSGVGKEKLARFGSLFIGTIAEYAQSRNISEKPFPVQKVSSSVSRAVKRPGSTYDETRKLIAQKTPLEEMVKQRGLVMGTIIGHIEKIILAERKQKHPNPLDISYLRPQPERFNVIKNAFEQCGTHALVPVRELLGESFSYEELRLARLFL